MHITDDGEVIAGGGDVSTDQPSFVRLLGDSGGVSHGVAAVQKTRHRRALGVKRASWRRRTGGRDGDVSVTYRTVADANAAAEPRGPAASGTLDWGDRGASDREIVLGIHEDNGSPESFESFHVTLENNGEDAELGGSATSKSPSSPMANPPARSSSPIPHRGLAVKAASDQIALYRNYLLGRRSFSSCDTHCRNCKCQAKKLSLIPREKKNDKDADWKEAEVPLIDDAAEEGDETLVFEGLSNPTGGAVVGAVGSTTVIERTIQLLLHRHQHGPPPPPIRPQGGAQPSCGIIESAWLATQMNEKSQQARMHAA